MIKRLMIISLASLFFSNCNQKKWDVDINDIHINTSIKRLDKALFELDEDSVTFFIADVEDEFGNFFELYNKAVIKIGGSNELDYTDKLVYFLTDPYVAEAYKQIRATDYSNEFADIIDGFKRYHYYFPEKTIPEIYTHVSGFNQSIIIDSSYISISLDKYLGQDSHFYDMLRTPFYLRAKMNKEKIPSDVLFSWALTEFPYQDKDEKLSKNIIYYGKLHVLLDALLPNTPDTLKWGFSDKKLDWCKQNERQMWLYLIENKLLFTSKYKEIKRFVDDGPFTTPFSRQSPSRTGRWIGYQIVNSYLKHHSNVSLKELMAIDDYQKILDESRYKP